MQRRSTPHLIHAKDRIIKEGKLGTIGLVEIYCYYHMRATQNPPDGPPPANLDYEMWTGPAPMRPYNSLVHPRSWRVFMEYGNGILGDMCAHARHGAGCSTSACRPGLIRPAGSSSTRRARQHHRHADGDVRLSQSPRRLDAPVATAARRIPPTLGVRPSTATRERSRPASTRSTTFRRPRTRRRSTKTSSWSSSSFRRTRPRRTSSGTWRRRFAGT